MADCPKCHGTLEVLANAAEPWSSSAYAPCPDCHPASKRLPRAWESAGDTVPVVISHEVKMLLEASGSPLAKLFTTPLYSRQALIAAAPKLAGDQE